MTPVRQRFVEDMKIRRFSPRSVAQYVRCVERFALHFDRSPNELDFEHVRQFLVYLLSEAEVSYAYPRTRRERVRPLDSSRGKTRRR